MAQLRAYVGIHTDFSGRMRFQERRNHLRSRHKVENCCLLIVGLLVEILTNPRIKLACCCVATPTSSHVMLGTSHGCSAIVTIQEVAVLGKLAKQEDWKTRCFFLLFLMFSFVGYFHLSFLSFSFQTLLKTDDNHLAVFREAPPADDRRIHVATLRSADMRRTAWKQSIPSRWISSSAVL